MSKVTFLSPAKLNLSFRVLAKRSDGFHNIASLFSAIDLFDRITLEKAKKESFSCNKKQLELLGPSNLVIKARDLFRKVAGVYEPLSIHLEKSIPEKSGLGGGSSNAATTLFAMNEMFDRPFSKGKLIELASNLGSDVSFFLSSGLAYCTGRGEIIKDVDLSLPDAFTLAMPKGLEVATPEVYGKCVPTDRDEEMYRNDLESAAFSICPELARVKERLKEHFNIVCMTGSGSAFFCLESIKAGSIKDIELKEVAPVRREDGWYRHLSNLFLQY